MTTVELLNEELDVQVELRTETSDQVTSDRWETTDMETRTTETPGQAEASLVSPLPKIRGLDFLKDGIYGLDLEKTIEDMFMVIRKMEAQLDRVLNINSLMEKDLQYAKDRIRDLKAEKVRLEETIAAMEEDIPSKREMQIEIDHILEERNSVEKRIRELERLSREASQNSSRYRARILELEEEKRDVLDEISYLESRLATSTEKTGRHETTINLLRGEVLAHKDKILDSLEEELKAALDEKYRAIKALKESSAAVADLRAAIAEKELHVKKAFYRGEEDKREGA